MLGVDNRRVVLLARGKGLFWRSVSLGQVQHEKPRHSPNDLLGRPKVACCCLVPRETLSPKFYQKHTDVARLNSADSGGLGNGGGLDLAKLLFCFMGERR